MQQKIDQETFKIMWDLSEKGGAAEGCFLRVPQIEYYGDRIEEPHPLSWMPDFKVLPESSLLPDTVCGVSFTTVTIDTPVYLNYLLARFLSCGGSIIRGSVQHINQVIEGAFTGTPDAAVVCAGLGARFLGGIEDRDVYPLRGQTILVRAPWIRFGRTISTKQGLWTYIIPRRSGDVIIGGTKIADDWYPGIRPAITEDILKRCFSLCPELASPDVPNHSEGTIEEVRPRIIEEGCGLRPARRGGIRLEVIWIDNIAKKPVPVVCNYGHGGMGYQSSWGTATVALELLEKALNEKE